MSGIAVTPGKPPRGDSQQAAIPFGAQSFHLTTAWGSSPASGIIEYVGAGPPVTVGASLQIEAAGHVFWGICKSDVAKEGSDGRLRTLELVDFREYLTWDWTFCAFNQRADRIVDGVLQRRYWHVFPEHFNAGIKTFTTRPLSARVILDKILDFTRRRFPRNYTVETQWKRVYHAAQAWPVFDIDFLGGRTLAAALQEISDKQGLVFGLIPTAREPYRLVWVRKGQAEPGPNGASGAYTEGAGAACFPPNSDQRRLGQIWSDHPTRVRIIGDRNLYQVLDIEMEPDWNRAWEQFLDVYQFEEDIYRRASDITGVRFANTPNDPEGLVGRCRAAALAKELTVRQYAELRARVRLPSMTMLSS